MSDKSWEPDLTLSHSFTLTLSLTLTCLCSKVTLSLSHYLTLTLSLSTCCRWTTFVFMFMLKSHILSLSHSHTLALSHSFNLSFNHSRHAEQVLFSCLCSKVTVNGRKLQCFLAGNQLYELKTHRMGCCWWGPKRTIGIFTYKQWFLAGNQL